ncbi:hypothetical protein PRZ48_011565 [Zasmidium cellare]|uniref:Uncharacterized protein n=1 Tax=Zasmidium cellare TaxID=395010 RepID=A0ABR0E6W9_ZASCE|nr:hypothetical protein PRZ48_011565 [Zasmidium cellare]
MASHQSTLPQFLKQSRSELHTKFVDLEWQQRNRLLQGTQAPANPSAPPSQWSRLSGDVVSHRNRYLNVEPYAQNRVKLRVNEGASDYINASPIQLGKRKYIATQGPKDTSVNHFYRMVASELKSPAVVVMLTQTHEAGREKCFQYYPLSKTESPLMIPEDQELDDGFQGAVELLSIEEDPKSRSEVRRLRLSTTAANNEPKEVEIHHLLFSGWPDFLVPEGEDRAALVELVRLSAFLNRPSSTNTTNHTNGSSASTFAADLASTDQDNPRIIHCSAGVGRSGTFIALDYLLSLMHSGQLDNLAPDKDPIAETVDTLRQQRMMMVQGESQFNFLYEVMREQLSARFRERDAVAGASNGTN